MKKDKNHKCTICNASFYQNSALKLHIAGIHEGKKPDYIAWKNNLTTHINGVHRGIKKQHKKKIKVCIWTKQEQKSQRDAVLETEVFLFINNNSEEYYGHIESNVDSESKFEFPNVKKKSGPYRKGNKRNSSKK